MKFPVNSVLHLSREQQRRQLSILEGRTTHLKFGTTWCSYGCNLVWFDYDTDVGETVHVDSIRRKLQIHINIGFHEGPDCTWDSVAEVMGDNFTDIPVEIMGNWPNGFRKKTVAKDLEAAFQFLADNIAEMENDFIRAVFQGPQ